ncbi:AAA family ATPase [Paenactinomyces guangxiensis]|uniref:ATP-binding protein n=1 Tax=Paenactinomyces guangxiensis TaxID=1490290 RepID=A0A7W1WR58_9BACL|nr:ATP-binding protein [Paenactinomyces guangxiensis]MBA4494366.1 ATP-binding protein [Paenactinomyces guangxiensis]MBH8591579.1 ATP-binding protein [Paenactinomyces guangxiensis]
MTKIDFIINVTESTLEENPQYYDHAIAIHGIKERLYQETGIQFHLYEMEIDEDELWDILSEDLETNPGRVKLLSHVYDCLEISRVSEVMTKERSLKYKVMPTFNNSIYYYPEFKVCLCKIPIYQAHEDYEYEFLFAPDHDCVNRFLHYISQRQREIMHQYINIFIDTASGVERKKESLSCRVNREDILLEPKLMNEIFRSIDQFFLEEGEFFKKYNIPYKRGILLYGKPGNGKTTLTKAITGSVRAPVVYWQVTEHTSSYTVNEVFSNVHKLAPIVLVIEDIDSMPDGVRSFFLNILDGAVSKEGVFLIGTTNYPERIDPALINRAGRFDRAYELRLPDANLREIYLLKKSLTQFITSDELKMIVTQTEGFSFAQLNEVYTSIALQCHYEGKADVEKIIADLRADNKSGKQNDWGSDMDSRLGFI